MLSPTAVCSNRSSNAQSGWTSMCVDRTLNGTWKSSPAVFPPQKVLPRTAFEASYHHRRAGFRRAGISIGGFRAPETDRSREDQNADNDFVQIEQTASSPPTRFGYVKAY